MAASICLPMVFQPVTFGGNTYVDGGLVSNLPAWPFDEERELDPAALTLAFDIYQEPQSGKLTWMNWPQAAWRTLLSGAAVLNLRAMRNAHLFILETQLDLLAFDLRPSEVAHQVVQSAAAAENQIARRVSVEPDIYLAGCAAAHDLVVTACYRSPSVFTSSKTPLKVRVGIALKDEPDSLAARIRYGAGFDADDIDRGIVLPLEHSIIGAAWRQRAPWLELAPFPDALNIPGETYAYLRRRTSPELAWILCVPIFPTNAQEPSFVVTVDSNRPLKPTKAGQAFAYKLSQELKTAFRPVVVDLES